MYSLSEFFEKYEVDTVELKIRGKKFFFFLPKDISKFINQQNPLDNFPLWARIWEGAIVLADYIYSLNLETQRCLLEIGSGVGVAGIIAASLGHDVTITDYNKDAIAFACANACKNLGSKNTVKIKILDWRKPEISKKYDYIIGSSVIYKEESFDPILDLFHMALKKDGQIILSENFSKNSLKFLEVLSRKYKVQAMKKILRSDKRKTFVILIKARPTCS